MSGFIVTIDGPAGSGKSTISRSVAKELGVSFLDTGAMYRAVTLMAMRKDLNLEDVKSVREAFDESEFHFEPADGKMLVSIDGEDVSEGIRLPEVTANVKYIANEPGLREPLVALQREFAREQGSIVTEGRDQGTVVFPDAEVKIYLEASVEERARRRYVELEGKGVECELGQIRRAIVERDESDMSREVGALRKACDAVEVDTSKMSIEEVVEKVLSIVRQRI